MTYAQQSLKSYKVKQEQSFPSIFTRLLWFVLSLLLVCVPFVQELSFGVCSRSIACMSKVSFNYINARATLREVLLDFIANALAARQTSWSEMTRVLCKHWLSEHFTYNPCGEIQLFICSCISRDMGEQSTVESLNHFLCNLHYQLKTSHFKAMFENKSFIISTDSPNHRR